jgi:hypothetical protein
MASKLFMRRIIIGAAIVFTLTGRPAWAQTPPNPQYQCMNQLTSCYYWAAAQAGFWGMWAAGIDCELAMIDCIRRAVIGR